MRNSWDKYFLEIAKSVATRATCDRKHVGAVVVKDKTILSTGYNGSVRGIAHCDEIGHLMEDGHCVRVVHAEVNAITQAAKHGVSIDGSSMYITCFPCWSCFKITVNAGIKRIIFTECYRNDPNVASTAKELDIELVQFMENGEI